MRLIFWVLLSVAFAAAANAAEPTCSAYQQKVTPNSPQCFEAATDLQDTDIVYGVQGTGPSRTNQSVKIPISQLKDVAAGSAPVQSVAGRDGDVTLSTTDISGLGTIATQSAGAVAITGGTISGANTSAAGVTATGGTTARTHAARAADVYNILDWGGVGDGSSDNTSVLNARIAVPNSVIYLPTASSYYLISGQLNFSANNVTLRCDPGVVIGTTATSGSAYYVTGDNVTIEGCPLAAKSGATASAGRVTGDYFTWTRGGVDGLGTFSFLGGNYGTVERGRFVNQTSTGIGVYPVSSYINILDNECQNSASLCIYVREGSHDGVIRGNWTTGNARELIGLSYSAYNWRIEHNRASGTGDNCISVTGHLNVISDNIMTGCAFNGLGIYGSSNIATGNIATNNGQVKNPASPYYNPAAGSTYSGINIDGDFGGAGQNNVVVGGFIDDDQATPTQYFGVRIDHASSQWTATTAYAAGTYIYNSGNFYSTTAGGTSGSSGGPTCTSGTCSADGTVTWDYLSTAPNGTNDGSGNIVSSVNVIRSATRNFQDSTTTHANSIAMTPCVLTGSGNPGSTAARIGCLYQRTGAQLGSTLYLMETPTGANDYGTVWSALATTGGGTPTLSSCGTSPTLGSGSTTSKGYVTQGTGATGCTVTFTSPSLGGVVPACQITWMAGGGTPAVTVSATGIVLTNPSGSYTNPMFSWFCQK